MDRKLLLALILLATFTVVAFIVGSVGEPAPEGQENEIQELGGGTGWTSLGITIGTFCLGWALTGAFLLGPWRLLRTWRVDIHMWTSIGALGFALFHGVELMALGDFRGWLSGWVATGLMMLLFVTGWWHVYWTQAWGRGVWRVVHWELALGAIAFSLEHWWLIDSAKGG